MDTNLAPICPFKNKRWNPWNLYCWKVIGFVSCVFFHQTNGSFTYVYNVATVYNYKPLNFIFTCVYYILLYVSTLWLKSLHRQFVTFPTCTTFPNQIHYNVIIHLMWSAPDGICITSYRHIRYRTRGASVVLRCLNLEYKQYLILFDCMEIIYVTYKAYSVWCNFTASNVIIIISLNALSYLMVVLCFRDSHSCKIPIDLIKREVQSD